MRGSYSSDSHAGNAPEGERYERLPDDEEVGFSRAVLGMDQQEHRTMVNASEADSRVQQPQEAFDGLLPAGHNSTVASNGGRNVENVGYGHRDQGVPVNMRRWQMLQGPGTNNQQQQQQARRRNPFMMGGKGVHQQSGDAGPSGRMQQRLLPRLPTKPPAIKPGKPLAPGQPAPQTRAKQRFVSLPETNKSDEAGGMQQQHVDGQMNQEEGAEQQRLSIFDDLEDVYDKDLRGRITSYCVAESIERKILQEELKSRQDVVAQENYSEVLYVKHAYQRDPGSQNLSFADVFYFDYGVVVTWNLTLKEERLLLQQLVQPALIDPLPMLEVEVDEFVFHYTVSERAHIQNDVFTINKYAQHDNLLKVSISHALAQSTKLSVYEYRVVAIVEETRDLPEILASSGKVTMSRKKIAQLMGRVFLQKSAVNLLSTVLDTPDFFWDHPDSLQNLYDRCTEYLEYENRVEVLNSRFQVLQEMLDMLRDHLNNDHTARLEWIVIWLILVEIVIGVFECLGIFGLVGTKHEL
eukprot:jgi/Picsp_1/4769/NSC_02137-R1_protein